jgi:phosphoserine aminotransferase
VDERKMNFAAGPAALPDQVLLKCQQDLLSWHHRGESVLEMSHRGDAFMSIISKAEADLRALL